MNEKPRYAIRRGANELTRRQCVLLASVYSLGIVLGLALIWTITGTAAAPRSTPGSYGFIPAPRRRRVRCPRGDQQRRDRVTKVIDALGHSQEKKYSSNDNIATMTAALQ